MWKKLSIALIACSLVSAQIIFASEGAKIIKLNGEVKVRRGLDETWQSANRAMDLNIIDSILILEGEVVLELQDGSIFKLGSNSMLDISDLRKITRKEMFLYLMSEKVDKIPARPERTKLRIGHVSVVHGESKTKTPISDMDEIRQKLQQELNGAKAMYKQGYYPNTVVKLFKMNKKYPTINDFGEIYFYLGKSFEEMNEKGQAVDAYQIALQKSEDCKFPTIKQLRREAEQAVKRLIQ